MGVEASKPTNDGGGGNNNNNKVNFKANDKPIIMVLGTKDSQQTQSQRERVSHI